MVEGKNPQQLVIVIKIFTKNGNFKENIRKEGYERTYKEFNTQNNTEKLVNIFKYYS